MILGSLKAPDAAKLERALADAEDEVKKGEPDKDEVGGAIERAVKYAKGASDFSEQAEKLAPTLKAVCSWLGQNWHKLLAVAGTRDLSEGAAMANGRNVQIGRDAQGNVIVTGDGNVFYLFLREPSAELLERLRAGQVKVAEIAEAVPLPTLTLAIAFADDERRHWRITARRPNAEPLGRTADVPWLGESGFTSAPIPSGG